MDVCVHTHNNNGGFVPRGGHSLIRILDLFIVCLARSSKIVAYYILPPFQV
jgi:hypothetical protein